MRRHSTTTIRSASYCSHGSIQRCIMVRVESSRFSLLKLAQQAMTRSKQSLERASLIMHVPMASQPASQPLPPRPCMHACMHACMGTKWKYNMWSESVGLTQRLTGRQALVWHWPTTRSNMRRTHRHRVSSQRSPHNKQQ
jgi:hypothetical protein